jgi:hypothetical protein
MDRKPRTEKNIARVAASTLVRSAGLGLAGLGAAAVAEAQPTPLPDYHWCPGQFWNPGWSNNWGGDRCHDDHWYDGEARDQGHWHGYGYGRSTVARDQAIEQAAAETVSAEIEPRRRPSENAIELAAMTVILVALAAIIALAAAAVLTMG